MVNNWIHLLEQFAIYFLSVYYIKRVEAASKLTDCVSNYHRRCNYHNIIISKVNFICSNTLFIIIS